MSWTKSHHGVSHLGGSPAHATVTVWPRFTEWFVYSWTAGRVVAEGVCRGRGHEAAARSVASRRLAG